MKPMKRYIALILALCLCGALFGCSRQEEGESYTFRAAISGVPATLDPAMVTSAAEKTAVAHLFENLMKLSSDSAVSGVARSYTCTDNEDGTLTYVFTLRDDVRWSDGAAVKAEDFVFAWQRLLDPELGSPNASILNTVKGYAETLAGDPEALQVWADEDGKLVVVLSEPDPYFLNAVCTSVYTMPVRRSAVEKENWSMSKSTLLTDGAYGLRQWSDGTMILVEVENYYDTKRLGPEQLELTFTATEAEALALYNEGKVDFASGVDFAEGSTMVTLPSVGVVIVNQMAGMVAQESVRRAMSMVIDRNALADELGPNYVAAEGIVPEGIHTLAGTHFRQTNGAVVDNNPENREANVAAARELLRQGGITAAWLLGKITLVYESTSVGTRTAARLQKQWKEELNIDVTLQPAAAGQLPQVLAQGEFTMALVTLTTDRNEADSLLRAWESNDPRNYGQYYSSAYELLLSVAAKSTNVEAHDAYLEDAERLLVESGYAMPLYMGTTSYILRSDIVGLFDDGLGVFYFNGVSRAPAVT